MGRNFFYYLFYEKDAATTWWKQNIYMLSNYNTVRNKAVKDLKIIFQCFFIS
jgi:hypothetical protein